MRLLLLPDDSIGPKFPLRPALFWKRSTGDFLLEYRSTNTKSVIWRLTPRTRLCLARS